MAKKIKNLRKRFVRFNQVDRKSTVISARVSRETKAIVKQVADSRGMKVSDLLAQMIQENFFE